MLELFKAEFRRYSKWALVVLSVQLMAWILLARLKPLLAASQAQTAIMYIWALAGCVAFGLIQMYLHKRKNNWTYLIQRPLHAHKIYLALAAAGAANILIAVPTAWIIMVSGFDLFTNAVVDMRHYYYGAYMTGLALIAYLIGSLAILSASRGTILLGIIVLLFIIPSAESLWSVFGPMVLMIVSLFYLNLKAFKPDLSLHFKSGFATILMAVPMQLTLVFLLMISTSLFYHIPRFMIGNHPDTNPVEGSFGYLWSVPENKKVSFLLKNSEVKNKEQIGRQAELADRDFINMKIWTFASKGQIYTRDKQYSLTPSGSNKAWTFSHSKMLLKGVDRVTGQVVGWLGRTGFRETDTALKDSDRFQTVPFLVGDKFILTEETIYQVDFDDQLLSVKHKMNGEERYVGLPQFRDNFVAIVSNKQTYIFDKEDFTGDGELIEANYRVPHPVPVEQVLFAETYRMVDGYIFTYQGREYHGFDKPGADLVYARLGGDVKNIHRINFDVYRHPAVIRHFNYMISPLLFILNNMMFHAIEPTEREHYSLEEIRSWKMPQLINIMIIILQGFSVVGAFYMSRRIRLSRAKTAMWTVMCALIGIPALVSFFLLNRVRGV